MNHVRPPFLLLFTTLAAAAMLAPASAAAPVGIESLSLAQRLSEPADTQVTVDGKLTTLGALRAAHDLRSKRFAAAATLGAAAKAKLVSTTPTVVGHVTAQMQKLTPTDPYFSMYGLDYQQFCTAAAATLCMYLPEGVSISSKTFSDFVYDTDPLVTDANVCSAGNGSLQTQAMGNGSYATGCKYMYPIKKSVQFVPGTPYKFSSSCSDQNLSATNDPHGAAALGPSAAVTNGQNVTFTTGSTPSTCVATVMVLVAKM